VKENLISRGGSADVSHPIVASGTWTWGILFMLKCVINFIFDSFVIGRFYSCFADMISPHNEENNGNYSN